MESLYNNALVAGVSIRQANDTFNQWQTESNFTSLEVVEYLTDFYYLEYLQSITGAYQTYLRIVVCIIGLVGYALEIFIFALNPSEFATPSFFYHKAIVAYDSLAMFCVAFHEIFEVIPKSAKNNVSFWLDILFYWGLEDFASHTAETITLFVTVERFVAIWMPTNFHYVNKNIIVIGATVLSTLIGGISLQTMALATVDKDSKGDWSVQYTSVSEYDWFRQFVTAKVNFRTVRNYTTQLFSILVVVGLVRLNRKKLTKSQPDSRQEAKKNRAKFQLCLLCLACSVPVTVACTLRFIFVTFLANAIVGPEAIAFTYSKAINEVQMAKSYQLMEMTENLVYYFAHSTHFYLYFAFSTNYREICFRTFGKLFGMRTKVIPVGSSMGPQFVSTTK